jgi:hypothetical protein
MSIRQRRPGIHFVESLRIVPAGRFIVIVLRDGKDAARVYHLLISTIRAFRYGGGLWVLLPDLTYNLDSDAALAAPGGDDHEGAYYIPGCKLKDVDQKSTHRVPRTSAYIHEANNG